MKNKKSETTNEKKINVALGDIEFIRGVLEEKTRTPADRTEMAMTALIAGTSLLLLIAERLAFSNLSDELINIGQNSTLRTTILLQAGIILALLASGIYGMAWIRARELQAGLRRTLKRSFSLLEFEIFVPDFFLKLFVFVLLFMTGQLQYLASLLVAFTADYVFQGKFFRFSKLSRYSLGAALYLVAGEMLLGQIHALFIPLAIFSSIYIFSFISIFVTKTVANDR